MSSYIPHCLYLLLVLFYKFFLIMYPSYHLPILDNSVLSLLCFTNRIHHYIYIYNSIHSSQSTLIHIMDQNTSESQREAPLPIDHHCRDDDNRAHMVTCGVISVTAFILLSIFVNVNVSNLCGCIYTFMFLDST